MGWAEDPREGEAASSVPHTSRPLVSRVNNPSWHRLRGPGQRPGPRRASRWPKISRIMSRYRALCAGRRHPQTSGREIHGQVRSDRGPWASFPPPPLRPPRAHLPGAGPLAAKVPRYFSEKGFQDYGNARAFLAFLRKSHQGLIVLSVAKVAPLRPQRP